LFSGRNARGADDLPAVVSEPLRASLLRELTSEEARRALLAGTAAALVELPYVDPVVAEKLTPLLQQAVGHPALSRGSPRAGEG
jgi:hypothetical protein